MRLFIGIPLAPGTAGELAALVSRLRARGSGLRWTRLRWTGPESWHITLQFLGNATQEQLRCLTAHLAGVHCGPVPVELGELGSFDRAGIFFAHVAVTPGLAALQQRVVAATARCGFVAEARPFQPHITLARTTGNEPPHRAEIARWGPRQGPRGRGDKTAGAEGPRDRANQNLQPRLCDLIANAGACRFSRFTAEEFLLYESHLSPQGSRYEVRARFPLIAH